MFAATMPGLAGKLAYDGLLAGAPATQVNAALAPLAERADATLVDAYAAHTSALVARDGDALMCVADRLEEIGALRFAMRAAAHAASTFVDQGRRNSARRAASRTSELHVPGQGTDPPAIDGVDGDRVGLAARESQISSWSTRASAMPTWRLHWLSRSGRSRRTSTARCISWACATGGAC